MSRVMAVLFIAAMWPAAVSAQETADEGGGSEKPQEASGESGSDQEADEDEVESGPSGSQYPPTFEGRLAEGHARYLATDYEAALDLYEQAKEMRSGEASAYYFIGFAQAALERWEDAIASLKTSATIAGAKKKALHARALFAVAVVQERRGDWKAAETAWKAYKGYAQTLKDVKTHIPTAESRLEAIKKSIELRKKYEGVREKAKERDKGEG
ncbi:MAG: hypothetical protein R6V85_02100 [Polyangia bacterium]